MKIFFVILICFFSSAGYSNNMEVSGIDISQFDKSFKPLFTKLITSFLLDWGKIKSGFFL